MKKFRGSDMKSPYHGLGGRRQMGSDYVKHCLRVRKNFEDCYNE